MLSITLKCDKALQSPRLFLSLIAARKVTASAPAPRFA
jgi:hypothetical protein